MTPGETLQTCGVWLTVISALGIVAVLIWIWLESKKPLL